MVSWPGWRRWRRQERGVLNKINDAPINGQSWTRENSRKHSAEHCLVPGAWAVSWSRDWWSEAELMFWNVTIYWWEVVRSDPVETLLTPEFCSLHDVHFISITRKYWLLLRMFYECCSQYVKYLYKESERCALFSKFITFSVLFISWMFMISPAFIISARLLGGIAAPQPSCGKLNFPYF